MRGLETILGNARTLWLPDHHADTNNFWCLYNGQGEMVSNRLNTNVRDHSRAEQVERHHMSIHKGGAYKNPLYHAGPGICPELNMRPGTRSILTYDVT